MRDLVLEERKRGKTIFFSTHILRDVETICDLVGILRKGEVVVSGKVRELLRSEARRVDIILAEISEELEKRLAEQGFRGRRVGEHLQVDIEGDNKVKDVLTLALQGGAKVVEVVDRRETLEDLFMRRAIGGEQDGAQTAG